MIIRILHEGQYEVEGPALQRVQELDDQIFKAVLDGDGSQYQELFSQAVQIVRQQGKPLSFEDLRPSELVLPAPDSTLDEVRSLFEQEGLLSSRQ